MRQDGRSASLTAPNGSAQRELLLGALGRAQRAPEEVACVEAHGTGTALGDPTEMGALAAVHRERVTPALIGAAKASVGHAEAASGQVGLLKLRRVLQDAAAPGNAQLRALNPILRERLGGGLFCFVLPAQTSAVDSLLVPGLATSGAGGVSSFGYSGTIAHAVVRRGRACLLYTSPSPRD